jgi:hypothetical protein
MKAIQKTAPTRAIQDRHARMRVRIAQETGRSPFDPKVVRDARQRVAKELDAEIDRALRDPLPIVLAALRDIQDAGRFGDRKVFIAALWAAVGRQIGMSLPEFKRWLLEQHRQQHLDLARADLVAAMPQDLVQRSEMQTEGPRSGATYHFVIDPSI